SHTQVVEHAGLIQPVGDRQHTAAIHTHSHSGRDHLHKPCFVAGVDQHCIFLCDYAHYGSITFKGMLTSSFSPRANCAVVNSVGRDKHRPVPTTLTVSFMSTTCTCSAHSMVSA